MMQLRDIDDSKEAIYGALDAWVAWEQKFPIGSLRNILIRLEMEQQWHRVVQVSLFCLLFFLFSLHCVILCQNKSLSNYVDEQIKDVVGM